ncbi:MAG: hypothetical protein H7A35_09460 [Planctomycetales bacterium]|nr:hypothetical protein [bacterium]UNM07105.1 MAG: hypothetical protein H7A35_09460 [Planctomycetales bacterium]
MHKWIFALLSAVFMIAANAQAQESGDIELSDEYEPPLIEIVATNAAGYDMVYFGMPYFSVDYSILEDATEARVGWSWMSTGEPLLFEHDGPLSNPRVDPLNPGVCPEGVDPAAMAAVVSAECIIRMPGVEYASLWPLYPIGRVYQAELPDGGMAWVRTAASAPALEDLVANLEGGSYPFEQVEPLSAILAMQQGKPAYDRSADRGMEEQLADTEMHSFLAYHGKEDRSAALLTAHACLERMLELYRERHNEYPDNIGDLTRIPGAVCAALPHSPWDFERELGMAVPGTVGKGDILYLPAWDRFGHAMEYRLLIVSDELLSGCIEQEMEGLPGNLHAQEPRE